MPFLGDGKLQTLRPFLTGVTTPTRIGFGWKPPQKCISLGRARRGVHLTLEPTVVGALRKGTIKSDIANSRAFLLAPCIFSEAGGLVEAKNLKLPFQRC